MDKLLLKKFRRFVKKWLKTHLRPLDASCDTSLETWLAGTTYSEERKAELRSKWDACKDISDPTYHKVKSFIKDEVYAEWKHARGINSRSDEYKCYSGPIFKLIEEQLYRLPQFIKHVPVGDRAAYIHNMLYRSGSKYMATDYTTFEALFSAEVMENCEFMLYEYMTAELPSGPEWFDLIKAVQSGVNKIRFRLFGMDLPATRMSGEMCTSLGNSFSNLMFMLFCCQEAGARNVDGVVEGDDGLFVFEGPAPTPELFGRLGLDIKLEIHDSLSTASFCGIVFDLEDRCNLTDPAPILATVGWTSSKYAGASQKTHRELLRAKALSYAHMYPGCPIVQPLAQALLRATRGSDSLRGYSLGPFNQYQRGFLSKMEHDEGKIRWRPIGLGSRRVVETKYGIPIDTQLAIEAYFENYSSVQPICSDAVSSVMHAIWKENWSMYVKKWDKSVSSRPLGMPMPCRRYAMETSPDQGQGLTKLIALANMRTFGSLTGH